MSIPEICFRIDFRDRCSIGSGKILLLEAIGRSGSLSQAARDISMSYRRAWLLIDNMNIEFDTPVVTTTVGGTRGGGAQLTAFGQELVDTYRHLEHQLASLTDHHMAKIKTHLAKGCRRTPAAGVALRERISRSLLR